MAYDTLTAVTDDLSDNLAEYQNEKKTAIEHVMSASAYAAYTRTQSMTGNVTLTDSDYPIQSFSPTAARDLTLPAVATTNHAFYIVNRSGTYAITIKNSGGTTVHSLTSGKSTLVLSDGSNGWYAVGYSASSASDSAWVSVSDSWTYASANTINIPSDGTTVYKKGMGIRLKQGGSYKYYYVTIVASALLTVTGGTDYTVANAAITDIAYTNTPHTAIGFPPTFALGAATWNLATIDNGSGGQPNNCSSFFSINGNIVNLKLALIGSNAIKVGTDNLIAFTVPATLPAIDELTLVPLGSAYVVAGSAGVVGISLAQSGTDLNLRYSANIADNTTTAYTSCNASFRY